MSNKSLLSTAIALTLVAGVHVPAFAQGDDARAVEEVRNTIINLLEALVKKGLLTQEQAQAMVADAQAKADTVAKAKADQDAAEKDAVRVAYVPQIVKDEISKQVSAELKSSVTKDVIAQAKTEQWGVPGALPDWVPRVRISGDVRVRAQDDVFADDNVQNSYLDYQAINKAGGLTAAGTDAFVNLAEDRLRERLRVRLAVDAQLTDSARAVVRLATGNLEDPVSPNQTLGNSGRHYQFAVDQAYLRYDANVHSQLPWMTLSVGRLPNPWVSTDLVFDPDLQFEGLASTWRVGFGGSGQTPRHVFLTLGAFPLQEIELSTQDKWLYGGQLGLSLPWADGARASLAGAYYYYDNIVGRRNPIPGDTTLDYTAPQWLQGGNTLFPIAVNANNEVRLYGLAADYHLLDVTAALELPVFDHLLTLTADYVTNLGYDPADVLQRAGFSSIDQVPTPEAKLAFDKMADGYQGEVAFGSRSVGQRNSWRFALAYRYLERDAVLDAFTDSDFHLGGTGAKGYSVRAEWWFLNRNWLTLRYITADEISHTGPTYRDPSGTLILPSDTPRFGVDTLMLDINGQF
jgi:polyhydroxyalkanoate synthesis regulator phasin